MAARGQADPASIFSDLQRVDINDFTPGIWRFSRGNYPVVYPSAAPLGSASTAFRCYAKPGIGLVPFPTYTLEQTFTQSGPAGVQFVLSIDGMACLAGPFSDNLVAVFSAMSGVVNTGSPTVYRWATRGNLSQTDPPTFTTGPTTVYSQNWTTGAAKLTHWANVDIGLFQNSGGTYSRSVIFSDFTYVNPNILPLWVSVPDWNSTSDSNSGQLLPPAFEAPRIFYHANRLGAFQCPFNTTTAGFIGNNGDLLSVSTTPLVLQPFSNAGVFFGELGAVIGTWGSISTGEFFGLYTQGGAVLIYGDLLTPTQVIKLPGVVGTGNVLGKAALTTNGLLYATEDDGVYRWNGGNTSEKISSQVPDDVFYRTNIPGSFGLNDHFHSSQAAWGQWVMFPNNWVYDQTTGSWWNGEDPAVLNFQVHAPSVMGTFFHSAAQGWVSNSNGAALSLSLYRWNKSKPAATWTWTSNPIPQSVGSLMSIQAVEIVASNPGSQPATITVTPTVPAGQTAFAQQNPSQGQTFTIPATTVALRQALRFGYTDSNIQLRVDAAGATGQPAPTLHAISVGWSTTRQSAVQ